MLIARRISDQVYSPDFQTRATAQSLINNAISAGFVTNANQLEILDVNEAEFEAIKASIYGAQWAQDAAERVALRNRVVTIAQGAIGVRFEDLSNAQRNALLAALLYQMGVLDRQGRVAPLSEWLG